MKMSLKEKIYHKIPESKREGAVKAVHALRIAKNIICWSLIIVLVIIVIVSLMMRMRGETPSIFGYTLQRVSTGSMVPALEVGDVFLSKNVDDVNILAVGDIITYEGGANFDYKHVTHRVVAAPYKDDTGALVLRTKGDANNTEDPVLSAERVESKYIAKITFLTKLYEIFLSPWGLLIFVGLLLLVFFDELLNVVRILSGNYSDEDEEDINDIIARIQREDKEKELAEKQPEDDNGE